MRRLIITAFILSTCHGSIAQPPVTSGLRLYLEAATGFNANGAGAATWQDQSGFANHVTSGLGTAEPVLTANAEGTGFPGVTFDGDDYLARAAASTTGFNTTAATLFVVRIANTVDNMDPVLRTTLSIAENNGFVNEFGLISNWAIHHSYSGGWIRRDHQCYANLPNDRPAALTAALNTGITNNDVHFFVNGIQSTNTPVTQSTPANYTAVNRSIHVGARSSGGGSFMEFFDGHMLEVLAYNRLLTQTEIDTVNHYLKCKYEIKYTACNVVPNCPPPASTPSLTPDADGTALLQNTPNPFGSETVIEYYIHQVQQTAAIIVYDLTGREVKRYPVKQGKGQVLIDGNSLAPGMYIYSMVVDGLKIDSKRMVLTR